MFHAIRVDYDDVFVSRSIELGNQVAELRMVRDALAVKRNELALKKIELGFQQKDQSRVKKELIEVTMKWRLVSDEIDELISQQFDHVNSCKIGY